MIPSFLSHSAFSLPSAALRVSYRESRGLRRRGARRYSGSPLWQLQAEPRSPGLSWSFFALGVFLILLAVVGGFLYIREITSTAASGYDISALERRAGELRVEETRLQLEAAELQSLRRIEERLPKLNLVPAADVAYTGPVLDGALAGQIPVGTARP